MAAGFMQWGFVILPKTMRYETVRTTIQSLFLWPCTDTQYTYHKRESASLFQDGLR